MSHSFRRRTIEAPATALDTEPGILTGELSPGEDQPASPHAQSYRQVPAEIHDRLMACADRLFGDESQRVSTRALCRSFCQDDE